MSVWFEHPAHHGARLRGRSVVSAHLMASSTAELLEFAARLGLRAEWIQHPGEVKEHFDLLGQGRCDAAQALGAELVDRHELIRRLRARREVVPGCSCVHRGSDAKLCAADMLRASLRYIDPVNTIEAEPPCSCRCHQ